MVLDMNTEYSSKLSEMDIRLRSQISGSIMETLGRLRDKIFNTKLDSMVTLKNIKTVPPREQDGRAAKRSLPSLTILQCQDSTPIIPTT